MKQIFLLIKITLLLFFIGAISQSSQAQSSASGLAKFVTPAFISGCNNDTIRIELQNLYGSKGIVYSGKVHLTVAIPDNPTIQYVGGSVASSPSGATSSTANAASTLDIDVPLPALGKTTIVKFVVRADCGVLKLNPLPSFSATVTYPTPYPVTSETINSAVLSVGNAQLNLTDWDNQNFSKIYNYGTEDRLPLRMSNAGYGSIDNVKVTVVSPTVQVFTVARIRDNAAAFLYGEPAPVNSTVVGSNTVRVFNLSGALLGPDGLLTPGESILMAYRNIAPNACGTYDTKFTVEYQCAGGGAACDAPQSRTFRVVVNAGTPLLAGKLVSVEYPDGCPLKKIVYDVTNTATGNGTPVGNAYDVKLGINLGSGKATLSTVTLNGVAMPLSAMSGGLSAYTIDATKFTTDPDGPGGLEDIDGDGLFDDMKPNAKTTVSFFYTIPCDIACGADLNYNFSSSNTFTDFCRTLAGATSTPLATFGFAQVQPIAQNNKVDFGILGAGESKKKNVRFNFQYKANNIDLSAGVATLCINYSKKFEFDPASVKLNGVPITGTLQGTDTQASATATDAAQTLTSKDSAWVHVLTAAETTALFDANPDSLSYSQTYFGCTDRQTTKSGDNWQLKYRSKAGLCTDGSTPCTFDLACKKAFVYGSGNACGTKPCWVVDYKLYRDKPVGSTDVTRTTPIPVIDGTRSYAGDTIAFDQNTYFSGKWYGEPIGQAPSASYDLRSFFTFNYSIPVGYKNGLSPWTFLENYSTVVVHKRIPNPASAGAIGTIGPVIFTAPLIANDLQTGFGGNVASPTTPRSSFIEGPYYIAPYNGLTYPEYLCSNGTSGTWIYQSCPASNYAEYGNNWYQREYNLAGDKAAERWYILVGQALGRAGYVGPSNDDEYYYEIKTKWRMNPDFPWDNSNSYSFKGGTGHGGNSATVTDSNSPSSSNTGGCNYASAVGTTVSKKHYISNPKQTYTSACGLRVSHKIDFKSFDGNYFRNGEVRVPLTIEKIVAKIPSEYALAGTPNISLKYNQSCAVQTYAGITASGSAGTVTFSNPASTTGGDYPRADDCSGNTTAYDLCYDLIKSGTAAPSNYKMPIEIYTKDEFGVVKILLDTISITEADPILSLTSVAASVTIADGTTPYGKVCNSFYTDYKITNNSLYDAPNVYIAAKGGATVTILDAQDTNTNTPILANDITTYSVVNKFIKIGTVKAGDTRIIRIYATTTACSGKVEVCADFGCGYPASNQPDPLPGNTNLVTATTNFTAQDPTIQSKPISNLVVNDFCANKTVEFEILNTGDANLYKVLSTLTLPSNASLVAGSVKMSYNLLGSTSGDYVVPAANVVGSGTSYTIDYKDNSPFKTTECGLPGSDERPNNVLRVKFDLSFTACPTGGAAQILFKTEAENYCGKKASTNASANLDFVGSQSKQNNFDLGKKDNPINICSPLVGEVTQVNDIVYIKNTGGYGALSGATAGADTAYIAFPYSATDLDVTDIILGDPTTFGSFPIETDLGGAPQLKIIIPAGIAVGDSVAVVVSYKITAKVAKLCQIKTPVLCIYAEFRSVFEVGCALKSISCQATKVILSKGLVPRSFKCCYGSIGDYVWTDVNNDGQQGTTAAEPPIAGVKVYLYQETAAGVFTKIDSTLTNASGKYLFDSLFTNNYKVQFVKPTGAVFTSLNTGATATDSDAGVNGFSAVVSIDATLPLGDIGRDNLTIDAGITPLGSIGDYVYYDKNSNGQQEATDTPIAGVTVNLLDAAGAVIATTTTDANGKYLFKDLVSGSYSVEFIAPAGYDGFTQKNIGAAATDSDAGANGKTGTFTIDTSKPAGDPARDITTVDAGLVRYGSIGDYVWTDVNNDGQQGTTAAEAPIAGITVNLLDAAGAVIKTTTTDASGKYLFDKLPSGDYKVQFVAPAGSVFAKLNTGATATDSDAGVNGTSGTIKIDTSLPKGDIGRDNPTVDAGIIPVGSIGDYVYLDKNADGQQQATDTPIAGVTVNLLDAAGAVIATTTTDASGKYLFKDLVAGMYSVEFVAPAGYDGFTKLNIGAAATDSDAGANGKTAVYTLDTSKPIGDPARDITTVDAGLVRYGSIGDYVWTDVNNDGQQGTTAAEAPIAGITVNLLDAAGAVIKTTTTDASGKYLFDKLPSGDYKVQFVKPAGTIFAKLNTGATATDSDAGVNGTSGVIKIDTDLAISDIGRNNPTVDAGIIPVGSVGDYVYYDKNADGKQDATDTPIAGVTVNLLDATGAIVATTTTDANGKYLFKDVIGGMYSVEFVAPVGYDGFTKINIGSTDTDSDAGVNGKTAVFTLDTSKPIGDPTRDITSIDAGLVRYGSIGDYVWTDVNNDGQQGTTAAEAPIAGVTVNLLDATTGAVLATTTTNASGKYLFDKLLAGDYKVEFVKPASTIYAKFNTGATATDSDAGVNGTSGVVKIDPSLAISDIGRNNPTIDAGIVPVGSIGDYVFTDVDGDNKQSPSDTPVAGVTVNLLDATGAVIATTTTDANGKYLFKDVVAGMYSVEFVAPTGKKFVTPNIGGTDKDSDVDANGKTPVFTLDTSKPIGDPARDITSVDAGIICKPDLTVIPNQTVCLGTIWKRVTAIDNRLFAGANTYQWYNANGAQNANSNAIVGQTSNILVVLPSGVGVYKYILVANKINGCSDTTGVTLTVISYPKLSALKDQIICFGADFAVVSTVDENESLSGTTNYQWYNNNGAANATSTLLAGEMTSTLTTLPTAVGVYKYKLLAGKNGVMCKDSVSVTLEIKALPVISIATPAPICLHNSATLKVIGCNGTVAWNDLVTGDTRVETPTAAGTYNYSAVCTDVFGCKSSANVSLVVKPNPELSSLLDQKICINTSWKPVQVTDAIGGLNTYQWYNANGATNPTTTALVGEDLDILTNLPTGLGMYKYAIIATKNGCLDTANVKLTIIDCSKFGSIGNYVWTDTNGDGQQGTTAAEAPIAGVKVYLLDATSGMKLDSTTTDINGKYLFDKLLTGDYKIQFVLPTGAKFTGANTGATATDSDAGVNGTSGIVSIDTSLPKGDIGRDNLTIDAGILPLGSISGKLWKDKNDDGLENNGEVVFGGVKIELYASDANGNPTGPALGSVVTSADGTYKFINLPKGDYVVKIDKTTIMVSMELGTKKNVGNDPTIDNDFDGIKGLSGKIVLDPSNPTTKDFPNINGAVIASCPPNICTPVKVTRN